MRRISGPTAWVLIGLLVAAVAGAGTATAAKFFIPKGAVQPKHLSKKTKKKLRGNEGPAGPQGPAGAQGATGATGPAGPAGTARGYGVVNNSGSVAKLQKNRGITAVRRSGNGIFCLRGDGLDPNSLPMVLTQDLSGDANGTNILLANGSGPIISSQCNGDEFQAVVFDVNSGSGVNNVSFTFMIP